MVENVNGRKAISDSNPLPPDMRERANLEASETIQASLRPRINGREIDESIHSFENSDYKLQEAHDLVPIAKGKENAATKMTTKTEIFAQKCFRKFSSYAMNPHIKKKR